MSDMNGNPFVNHIANVPTTDAEAQMNATLALAYEQRTANLIALLGEGFAHRDLNYAGIEMQIAERLGL